MLKSKNDTFVKKAAYHLVRRAQASIAAYQNFGNGDLSKFLERDSFLYMAERLADHYFYRSKGLVIHGQVKELYLAHLIMAAIIQRLPLSAKYDWHRGHLLSWFRCHANERRKHYHFSVRTITRNYQPDELRDGLVRLGIHDAAFVAFMMDIYRRHAGGTALKDKLAHQLFDPILLHGNKMGHELRFGNCLFKLEKRPFDGSSDLRSCWVSLLNYSVHSEEHQGSGRHLEIVLSDGTINNFRERVKQALELSASTEYKVQLLEHRIRDFVEHARWARSAEPQAEELRRWLNDKLRPLAGTLPAAKPLASLVLNLWYQRADHQLYLKAPSFFFDPKQIDEKTYTSFFSPYREVLP